MKNVSGVNEPIKLILFGCFSLLCSCSSYWDNKDITMQMLNKYSQFAADTDSIAIKSISLYFADKRFYDGIEHTDLAIEYHLSIRNTKQDTAILVLRDSLWHSNIYALYQKDTVGWLVENQRSLQIPPKQTAAITISNIGFMGGANYVWETLFHKQDDYTADILGILADIKIYCTGQLVLPSPDLTVTISDYKDRWLLFHIHRLLGDPYWSDRFDN